MKRYIYIALFSFLCFHMFGQDSTAEISSNKELVDDWYIGAGAGVQILFSSDAENLSFGDRITPSITVTGGKWFSPYWGAWLQVDGFSLNGFSTMQGTYKADPLPDGGYGTNDPVREYATIRPDGSYRHYIRYINANVGLQISILNLVTGYKPSRQWDIIPGAGIGYFQTLEYEGIPSASNISGRFFLRGKYSVLNNLDINLEVSSTLLPDKFDGRLTDRNCESTLAAKVGVVYNFKKEKEIKSLKGFSCKRKAKKNTETGIGTVQVVEKTRTVTELLWDTVVVKEEVPHYSQREPFVLASIRFDLGKDTPIPNQEINLANVVKYLHENPGAKIRLEGYGDRDTGTEESNLNISIKRINNIRKQLIEIYKVDASRIEAKAYGSDFQPYEKSTWNRVVVIRVL